MKILIIVPNFIPEIGSAAHIYNDLARAFVRRGHTVDVITSYPRRFYLGNDDKDKKFLRHENICGVEVHRDLPLSASRDNVILRGLEHYLMPVSYFLVYLSCRKRFDACLIYIPPLPLAYLGRAIRLIHKTPVVLNIQDFHPQELVDVGMLQNRLIIGIMERMERSSYKNADYVSAISRPGKDLIVARGGKPERTFSVYNSVEISSLGGIDAKKDFKEKYGLTGRFVVTYAGILSPFQGLDDILDAAIALRDHKDIVFYIVGDGIDRDRLKGRLEAENIDNVRILPLQPRDEYFNIICSSDVNLVTLDKRMTAPLIPGKFPNLLAVRVPIVASVREDNDIASIMRDYRCGIVVPPGSPERLAKAVLRLHDDPGLRQECMANGRKFLEDNMDVDKSVIAYENILRAT